MHYNGAEELDESNGQSEVVAVWAVYWRTRMDFLCPAGPYFPSSEVVLLTTNSVCRSRWPRVLRRGSAAARLLGLWVLIPPGVIDASLFCKCCVLSGGGLCDGQITRPEESHRVCVCVSLSVIRCDSNPLHLQWVGRRRSE